MIKQHILYHKSVLVFLDLLKFALWGKPLALDKFQELKNRDWENVYRFAYFQTLDGLIAHAAQQLPSFFMPEQPMLYKMILREQQIREKNEKMNTIISELDGLYNAEGIRPILQKGQAVAQYYPNPSLRVCGDIDWYFERGLPYNKAFKLMVDLKTNIHFHAGYSCGYDWKGLHVEHHQRLIQARNPWNLKFLNKLQTEEREPFEPVSSQGFQTHMPNPFLNSIMLNVHILSHQVGYGIGLRQLCDVACLYHTQNQKLDGDRLKFVYKKLGVLAWMHKLHYTLVKYLGLKEENLPFPLDKKSVNDWMIKDILFAGNFAFHDSRFPDINNPMGRMNRIPRLFYSFSRYLPIAPSETVAFPIIHVISKFHR